MHKCFLHRLKANNNWGGSIIKLNYVVDSDYYWILDSELTENKVSSGAVFKAAESHEFQMIYSKPETLQFVDSAGEISSKTF